MLYYSWISDLVVLPSKEHEIVGSSALKFFVGYRFVILGFILSSTWSILYLHEVQRLVYIRFEGGAQMLRIMHLDSAGLRVGAGAGYFVVCLLEPLHVYVEWMLVSRSLDYLFRRIDRIVLWTRTRWFLLVTFPP